MNSSILRKLYVHEGRSIRAVGKVLRVGKSTIHRALKKAGIQTRPQGRPRKKRP